MKKHAKKTIKTILLLLIPLFLFSLSSSTEQSTQADITRADPEAPFIPSDPPKKTLGIWTRSGYNLQPQTDYYTVVGQPVTLRTNVVRSAGGFLIGLGDAPHYRWWTENGTGSWTSISKGNNGQKKNFPITPEVAGDITYQLDTQYYKQITGWMGLKTHYFSNQATVHASPEPVEVEELEVTVDDDYVYYTSKSSDEPNITNAHAIPTPANATGNVTWSIDDTSLATIDEDGQITANSNSKSGKVTATATMSNYETPDLTGSAIVEIGGGLDDQRVKSGQTADFTLKGNTFDEDENEDIDSITVSWTKYPPGSNSGSTAPNNVNDTTYTTPITTMADNGSQYQATIKVISGKNTKTITSNRATLTVIPAGDPALEITNTIINDSYTDTKDTEILLNNVIGGDSITYKNTVTNNSTEGPLVNGFYVIPLQPQTIINSVTVAGEVLPTTSYETIYNADTNSDDLVIDIDNIDIQSSKDIEVNTTAPDITTKKSFEFTPYVYGDNADGNGATYRQDGTISQINYITDKIQSDIADIDFGTITAYSKDTLLRRPDKNNSPSNIANIDDQRRDKTATKVFVTQLAELTNEQNYVLPATIRYYKNGNYETILNNKVKISETLSGNGLGSIAWGKDDGLLLHINENHLPAGQYSTILTWSFENSL